uniref:Nuclear pore complex protein Nup85 n=2 Tax=Eptatretus burgeri TaxID=7764 RepID=A0A8C4QD30_EPTBU
MSVDEEEPSFFEMVVPGLHGKHLGMNWTLRGLGLYSTNYSTSGEPGVASIVECERERGTSLPMLRSLYSELHAIFVSLQKEVLQDKTHRATLVAFSRNYRSVMRGCMEEIQNVLSSNQNHQSENGLAKQISQLSALELIWHLCEVLFLESLQSEVFGGYFIESSTNYYT